MEDMMDGQFWTNDDSYEYIPPYIENRQMSDG